MWHTERGDRILDGKERSLFIHGAACLLDHLLEEAGDPEPDPDNPWYTDVSLFDRLAPEARIVLLRDVVQALTAAATPMPDLTATNEAAVYAVFRFVRGQVEMEIDTESDLLDREPDIDDDFFFLGHDPLYWRRLTLAAYLECLGYEDSVEPDDEEPPDPSCTDLEEWDLLLECLADQILWDRDWELEEIMDAPPKKARAVKQQLGIDPDYFIAAPADPDPARGQEAVAFLRRLAEEDRGDQEYATATLRYGYEGLTGVKFADPDLERQHGFGGDPAETVLHAVEATIPVLLAVDAARVLKQIEAAGREEGKLAKAMRARERVSQDMHGYLPEGLRKRFRRSLEIARGISVQRDYGKASAEFDVEKFAGVDFDQETREQVRAATEGLTTFLLNLVSDPNSDFADPCVREALIATAEQMAAEFAGVEDNRATE